MNNDWSMVPEAFMHALWGLCVITAAIAPVLILIGVMHLIINRLR